MKKSILTAFALLAFVPFVSAQQVSSYSLKKSADNMNVDMTVDISDLAIGSNKAVLLTPVLSNGRDSVMLDTYGVYGRRRYIVAERNDALGISGSDESYSKAKEAPEAIKFSESVPYQSWMNGATLYLNKRVYGCCSDKIDEVSEDVGRYDMPNRPVFTPSYVYVQPESEVVKSRSLEGSAFIDFVVNKTDINPTYRRNVSELAKIRATIDSVRNDSDIDITAIYIKGYASPEGSYKHNEELAKGRTEALKEYVRKLYNFPASIMHTSYEPEDWEGLKKYLREDATGVSNAGAILDIIAQGGDKDKMEAKYKAKYPADYKYLLANVYPALRHSDYKVEYNIRSYADPVEIAEIMAKQPSKLSLNEFHLLGQQYEPGSEEFNDVFETAVKMYPNDESANLNAANAAMARGDMVSAEKYLKKAGNSAEADYARGIFSAIKEDWTLAESMLKNAKTSGVSQASGILDQINAIKDFDKKYK